MQSHHQPGDIIADKYQIVGILGEGNSGITYQATDLNTKQEIALKAMSLQNINDWKLLELFAREAKILAKLDHPHIPTYLDYFQVDTTNNRAFYIAQELAKGQSLASLVEGGWHKSEEEIKEIAIALLKILVYLHLQKPAVIHRDIKPQNIIRRDDGKIFLVDFGAVGHTYHNTMMRGSTVVGTYGYMAPEQFRGQAFTATDLYGLGATLLYLLTHRSPAELPTDRLRIDFRSHIQVSEEFGDWLEKILEPDMSERFPSAAAALEALQPKKISITKSVSWKTIVLTMGIGMGAFFATKSLNHQKYAVFNQLGLTPHVHAAIYQDLIDTPDYLARGGDINGKDKQGKTLLHYAVKNSKLDLARLLIDRGADINQVDIYGNTVLYTAIDARHTQLISLLKEHNAKLNNKDLKQLNEKDIERLGLSLHKNICNPEKISFLISNGIDIDVRDKFGSTLLHRIANTNCPDEDYRKKDKQLEIAKLLIDAGADVNAQDSKGKTPLHLIQAVYDNYNSKLAAMLVEAGANINAQDKDGKTPLHIYVNQKGYYSGAIKFLAKAGANINAQDKDGKTPLHLAGNNPNSFIERLLVELGANIHIVDHNNNFSAYTPKVEKSQQHFERYLLEQEIEKARKEREIENRRKKRERIRKKALHKHRKAKR